MDDETYQTGGYIPPPRRLLVDGTPAPYVRYGPPVTAQAAADHVQQHCPNPHDVSTMEQRPGTTLLCGCGQCPEPDLTPEQYRRKIEDAVWHATADAHDRRWAGTEHP
jgi:hypothetical protein